MTTGNFASSQQKAARAAGALYLFIIVGSVLMDPLVVSRLIVKGDAAATAERIASNPSLFRVGTLFELAMAGGVVALAVALYVIVKPVNRNLALLALCWRLAEAILWAVAAVVKTMALKLASGAGSTALEPGQRAALIEAVLGVHSVALDVVVLFCGVGTFLFLWLLYGARYVPRALAAWGLLSYLTCVAVPVMKLLSPGLARFEMAAYIPGALFELAIGAWLLVKGVDVARPVEGAVPPAPVPEGVS